MHTETFFLPDFHALLPQKPSGEISPHFRESHIGFSAWAKEKFGVRMATEVLRADLPLFTALAWPLASCQQLRGILNYMMATLFLEELTDHCSSAEALPWSKLWIKTFEDDTCLEGENSRHPFIKMMLSELVPSMKGVVGSFFWPQFTDGCKKFAMNVVQEALDREAYTNKKSMRDIQAYRFMRRETIAVRPCFALLRSTRQLYIPDDVLARPAIQEMEDSVTDMFWIVNDVFSYKKEYDSNGALNNLLTVMQRDPQTAHLDLQGRLDYAEGLFRAALDRFSTYKRQIPVFDSEMDQYIALYIDGMMDLVVANLQWSVVTPRYNAFMGNEDRKNNIMRLALDTPMPTDGGVPA